MTVHTLLTAALAFALVASANLNSTQRRLIAALETTRDMQLQTIGALGGRVSALASRLEDDRHHKCQVDKPTLHVRIDRSLDELSAMPALRKAVR